MKEKFAGRVDIFKSSEIRDILKLTERPEVITFAGGLPAPELFPVEELNRAADKVLTGDGAQALQYSCTEGYKPLRKLVAETMRNKGVNVTEENIIITSGSQQGLDLTGKVFIDEGNTIICESPTYMAAIYAFSTYRPKFIDVAMDDDGMIMEELAKALSANPDAKFIYISPDFQNPTGRTLSLERRKRLIELANEFDVIVVEDNPYCELRFAGEIMPPIKSFDTEDRVIYKGTFSKIVSPGLRIGWICGCPEIIEKYSLFKQGSDLHTNTLSQMMVAELVQGFDLDGHINKIREVYGRRRNLMLKSMEAEFPDCVTYTRPEGGIFIWATLPAHINARELLKKCLDNNVAFVPGEVFFPNGGNGNTMRLNYSSMPESLIEEGIARMGKVLRREI
ncbi:MAG: PLP-dependent aminotransferase family protein [Bacillota bacterium]